MTIFAFASTVALLWVSLASLWPQRPNGDDERFDMTVEMSDSRSYGYRMLIFGFLAVALAFATFAFVGAI